MSLFRRLGRRFERYRQAAKRAAEGMSNARCRVCGAWTSARHDRCPECGHQPPHEVLNVAPDAPEAVVKAAARERLKATHPDRGGSRGEFQRVKRARDRLLDQ